LLFDFCITLRIPPRLLSNINLSLAESSFGFFPFFPLLTSSTITSLTYRPAFRRFPYEYLALLLVAGAIKFLFILFQIRNRQSKIDNRQSQIGNYFNPLAPA